jgi:hypothetical protein
MVTIKISKEGTFYLSENNIRLTNNFSNIELINDTFYLLESRDNGIISYSFYNLNSKKNDFEIQNVRMISKPNNNNHFTLDAIDHFVVYEVNTFKEIVKIKKNIDLYNFFYISDGYSIYEENLYKGSSVFGKLADFPVVYKEEEERLCVRKIELVYISYLDINSYGLDNRMFTIFKTPLPKNIDYIYVANKNFAKESILFIKSNEVFEIRSGNKIIYTGKIDEDSIRNTYNVANKSMLNISDGDKKYIITPNLAISGPLNVSDFEFNRIFKCQEYTLYYKDNFIVKYDTETHTITENKSKLSFELHLNVKTDVLFIREKEYALLSIGDEMYFYNDIIHDFVKIEESIYIVPYIYENSIYFLDENLQESLVIPELDIRDLIVSDYTYFNNNIYVILKDEEIAEPNGTYIVYDVKNKKVLKSFNSFIEFTDHIGFYLNDIKHHSSSFIYSLDINSGKIIKMPFKTKGLYYRDNQLLYKNMFNTSVKLNPNEQIYLKEN